MQNHKDKTGVAQPEYRAAATPAPEKRLTRLAEALRANLARRKKAVRSTSDKN